MNAGTDAGVYLRLCGKRGSTPKILLEDERKNFKRFERGRADKFVVQTVDVGGVSVLMFVVQLLFTSSIPYHVIGVCLLSQSASEKHNQEIKAHKPVRTW